MSKLISPQSIFRAVGERVRESPWETAALALFGLCSVLILLTFRDYGMSWDEPVQAQYGEYIIRWYRSGFRNRSALHYLNLPLYGGFFDVLAQTAVRFSPIGMYETRHLVNAAFGLASVIAVYRLTAQLAGQPAGFLAMLFLLATPAFYGHAFINPKDIPFAALYTWTVYFVVLVVPSLPRIPLSRVVPLGIALGLTLAVRIGGVLLFGVIAAAFVFWWVDPRYGRARAGRTCLQILALFHARLAAVGGIAILCMLPWWPWAQVNPLIHPFIAMRTMGAFDWNAPVLFNGASFAAADLPWHYPVTWLLISLPEFLLAGLVVALLLGGWAILHGRLFHVFVTDAPYAVLVFSTAFPLVSLLVSGSTLYDGQRHFLFVVPGLAAIAAIALVRLFELLPPLPSLTCAGALGVSLLITVADMVALHPYQYVYFNRLIAGGLAEAGHRFETDYWGTSYKEGVEWLAQASFLPERGRITVASCSEPALTEYYLPQDRFTYVGSLNATGISSPPNIFLATTRWGCHRRLPGRIIHVVERQGMPLLYVKQVDVPVGKIRPLEAVSMFAGGRTVSGAENRTVDFR